MRYGVNLPVSSVAATPGVIADAAKHAEQLGFRSLWVGDHVAMPVDYESRYPYSEDGRMTWDVRTPWLDPLMTLLWAAAATTRIRIGTAVLVPAMRPVVLLAKQLATLDHLANGRLVLGVGMGWLAEEFTLLGQGFDRRGARMTEAVEALRECWREPLISFKGEFINLPAFACDPKPAQGASLPVLIGGTGDLMLKRVASLNCGWLPIQMSPAAFAERRAFLGNQLEATGRSIEDVPVVMQADAATFTPEDAGTYAALGVDEVIVEVSWRSQSADAAMREMERLAQRFGLDRRAA